MSLFGKKPKPQPPREPPVGLCNLHCHILAGVDDGAKDEEEMYKLIKLEYSFGVRHLCFTPHYNPALFEPKPSQIAESYMLAKKYVKENLPDMNLYLGNEVFMRPDTIERLRDHSCKPLGDSNVVLTEFHPTTSWDDIRKYSVTLLGQGYTPLLAHIERYDKLNDIDNIYELKGLGVKFQINTAAFDSSRKKLISKLVEQGVIDVISDDRHNEKRGDPPISECYTDVEERFGSDAAYALFIKRPRDILNIPPDA